MADDRKALEARWLELTRRTLPSLADERRWPVRADHCFQRILLDAACGMRWYDAIDGRPAYRHIGRERLEQAIALGDAVVLGEADIAGLDARSLEWRRRLRR